MFFKSKFPAKSLGIDRDSSVALYKEIIEAIKYNLVTVIDGPTGGGKTFTVSRMSTELLKIMGNKSVFFYLTPTTSTIGSAAKNALHSAKVYLKTHSGTLVMCIASKYMSRSTYDSYIDLEKSSNGRFKIVDDIKDGYFEFDEPEESAMIVIDSSQKIIDHRWKIASKILKSHPSYVVIDEFHYGFAATDADLYAIITENGRKSFSGKKLEKLFDSELRSNPNYTVVGLTGTPTLEHRGEVQSDKSCFRYVSLPRQHFVEYLKTIADFRVFTPKKGIGKKLDIDEVLYYFDFLNSHRERLNNDLFSMIKVGEKIITKIRSESKNIRKKYANMMFYTSEYGLCVLDNNGFFSKIDDSLTNVREYLLDEKTPYNTIVVNQAGTMGFDIPEIDTIADLSTNQKNGEQYGPNQFLGRGIRKCMSRPDAGLHIFVVATHGLYSRIKTCARFWYGDLKEKKRFFDELAVPELLRSGVIS